MASLWVLYQLQEQQQDLLQYIVLLHSSKIPYMLVVFTTAIVVTSSIGDSFCGVVMNIPVQEEPPQRW